MKYIKTYEEIDFSAKEYKLHPQLVSFLTKFIEPRLRSEPNYSVISSYYERGVKHGVATALEYREGRIGSSTCFSIRVLGVSDKKLRDLDVKPKLKVEMTYYQPFGNFKDEFGKTLYDFISDVFRKYSYFNKPYHHIYRRKFEEFYINKKDIPSIMMELNENFEIYTDSKKYNL